MYLIGYKFPATVVYNIVCKHDRKYSPFREQLDAGPDYYPYSSWLEEYVDYLKQYNEQFTPPYNLSVIQDGNYVHIGYFKDDKDNDDSDNDDNNIYILSTDEQTNILSYIQQLNDTMKEMDRNSDQYNYYYDRYRITVGEIVKVYCP